MATDAASSPRWLDALRAVVHRELGQLQETLRLDVDQLAARLSRLSRTGAAPTVEEIQVEADDFLGRVAPLFEGLAERLADTLSKSASPRDPAGVARLAGLQQSIRFYVGFATQYLAGYVQGGGVALALMLELEDDGWSDKKRITTLLRGRLGFLGERADLAATQWLGEVSVIASDLDGGLASTPAPAPAAAARPAPAPVAAPVETPADRYKRLLALAEEFGVRFKKLPDNPTNAVLDKIEAQLAPIVEKKRAAVAEAEGRKQRLAELMSFAAQLGVKVKAVPDDPPDVWLNKMEAKLVEVAEKKKVSLPESFAPPTSEEMRRTTEFAPERYDEPDEAGMSDEERRERIAAMLEKAESADVKLGRIPDDPTDDWIQQTEARLDALLEERRKSRRAEREKRESERKQRIETLRRDAAERNVDIGRIPPFPTDDWLARAEIKVASASLDRGDGRRAGQGDERRERLRAVRQGADEAGIDLGEIPPDPDDVWLTWAEGRVEEQALSNELIAAGEDDDEEGGATAVIIYEEGTVQEQAWPVDDEISIGRARGCTIQVRDDPGVSRRHCTIFRKGANYCVRDDGSTKGTFVEGKQLTKELRLRGGERIVVGETVFVFRMT